MAKLAALNLNYPLTTEDRLIFPQYSKWAFGFILYFNTGETPMTTSKPRVRAYVDHDTFAKLQFATTRPHVTISDTVNNALKAYLSDEYALERESAIIKRMDRIARETEALELRMAITSEAMALFIRHYLTATPKIPKADQDAARARGEARYDAFKTNLRTVLEDTTQSLYGAVKDIYTDTDGFFTAEELNLLHKPAP